jgi:glycosyltransferase involved in cell wall biosynthesis
MCGKYIKGDLYISVIITAHNRKEFLKEAINSVINQTLNRDFYEIIVIKNFDDQEIDNLIEKNKIISLKSRDDSSSIGGKLALGIERAKGEIISFLEDDDLFMPEKLETVYNFFKKYEDLVYLHNSEYFIDEKGSSAKFWVKDLNKNIILDHFKNLNKLFKLEKYGLYFNMSSISIRKNKILPYLENLEKIDSNSDDYMFFISTLEEPKLIILLKDKLTKYRVHQSATVFFSEDINKFLETNIKKDKLTLYFLLFITNLVEQNKIYKLFIKYRIILQKIKLHLLGYRNDINLNEILFFLYVNLKGKYFRAEIINFFYISLFIFSKISYKWVRKFYSKALFKYKQEQFKTYIT